ncbi:MAG: FHA domain-containing protein [Myxococcaceae bacterium]
MVPSLLAELPVVCRACDVLCAAQAATCKACGASLTGAVARAATASIPRPPHLAAAVPRPTPPAPPPYAPSPASPPARPPPPPEPRQVAKPAAGSRFIVTIVSGQLRGQRFRLMAQGCAIGRNKGAITFKDDPTVSQEHAVFLVRDNALYVRDVGSDSGVFASIHQEEPIGDGALFALGDCLLRYVGAAEAPPLQLGQPLEYGAPLPKTGVLHRVEEILSGGRRAKALASVNPVVTIGQGDCDFTLPNAAGVAGRHCEIHRGPAGPKLRDVSGGLGTFTRLPTGRERELAPGDRVRIGGQVIQVDVDGAAA